MATKGLKDGLFRHEVRADDANLGTATIDATELAANSVDTSELVADSVDHTILSKAFDSGHFTLGTGGQNTEVTLTNALGSPMSVVITPLASTTDPPFVTAYDSTGSAFEASGAAAIECAYIAWQE